MSTTDQTRIEAELLRLAKTFDGVPPPLQQWDEFDAFIFSIVQVGLDRGNIFNLLRGALMKYREVLSEHSDDALSNYLDGLTGNCAVECCPHFTGEPTDQSQFVEYLYSKNWMKDEGEA